MENLLKESELNNLELNKQSLSFLQETAKWCRFIAILGFIGIGFMVVFAFSIGNFLRLIPNGDLYAMAIGGSMTMLTIVYILIALLYFFPVYYLYKFSINLKQSIANKNNGSLTKAFEYLKSHYKFIGILCIVILSFYAFVFLIAIAGAAFM